MKAIVLRLSLSATKHLRTSLHLSQLYGGGWVGKIKKVDMGEKKIANSVNHELQDRRQS